ncbi:MAG: glutamate--tRNA ligase [Deltaproteobacteria bacterium]|nr:glutamate--tRNA ligase [Deltaproteobacteria bacterium]
MTESAQPVRVRFAPSPTGYLHIGGVRTALFNYLFAKHTGGKFVLRIEDTDTGRSESIYTEDILKSLQWLGLNWDEGPIFQSQRFERYREACRELVRSGHAYYCYCSPEELDAERKLFESAGKKPMYGGKCRPKDGSPHEPGRKNSADALFLLERQRSDMRREEKSAAEPDPARGSAVIRFKVPKSGETAFTDAIRGRIAFQNSEIEDFVILRANGAPTYNLACVVDDYDGKMTHIIRGDDHINNTPKQVLIFEALGYPPPIFAHLPMILGADKKKLSKRHGSVSANQYRAEGYLPHAVINYLARLGWGRGDQEVFSLEELVRFFTLEKIGKSNAVFNVEKLMWLNGHYIRLTSDQDLAEALLEDFGEELRSFGEIAALDEKLRALPIQGLIGLSKQKVRTLKELAVLMRPLLFEGEIALDAEVAAQWNKARLTDVFEHVLSELKHLTGGGAWKDGVLLDAGIDPKKLEMLYRATADRFGMKLVELAQPTRFFLTGSTVGPQLFDVIARLPAPLVFARLKRYADILK